MDLKFTFISGWLAGSWEISRRGMDICFKIFLMDIWFKIFFMDIWFKIFFFRRGAF